MAKEVVLEEEEICKTSSSWIASTNWIVSNNNGSLNDSISFETPMSSIKDDEQEEEEEFKDSETRKHQSVVLIPPPCSSSGRESSPCEIKLSFEQRHEIRQVYVRSTARVFEIYYATGSQNDNEYLCTVRCGIAAKEDAPLSASATEEDTSVHSKGSTDPKELLEEKTRSESNSSTDDDGWIEIKVPDSALLHSKPSSVAKCVERNIQDFYEATAEINDSSPCISITLRLLSLHTKGCINLEEIYVFGEPVDPTDCDDKVDPLKRSSESSMMAMLVPTLLQLSKTGALKRTEDKHVAEVRQGLKRQNDESPGSYMGGTMQKEAQSSPPNREEVDLQAAVEGSSESAQIKSNEPDQGTRKGTESVNYIDDSSSGRVERVLDQLVSRIGRIEALCSRFEENMLKPISNIETRLERLEQKLEGLTMQSQSSYMHPCTRITSPDFSCVESETHSLQNDENEINGYRMSDLASNGTTFTRPSVCNSEEMESKFPLKDKNCIHDVESGSFINNDASDSEVVPQLVPGLIIAAPEFSSEDDNNDGIRRGNDTDCNNDFVVSKMGFPVNKPSLSIDDAVAMALAGFMSFAFTPNSPDAINDKEVPLMSSSSNCSTDAVIRNCLIQEEGIVGSCDETSFNKIKDKDVPRRSSSSNSSTDAVIRNWKTPQVNYGQGVMFPSDDSTDSDKTEGEVHQYKLEDTTNGFTSLKANGEEATRLPHDDSTEARFRGGLLQEEGKYGGCDEMIVNQIITGNNHEMQGEVNLYELEDATNRFVPLKVDSNFNIFDDDVQKSFIVNSVHNTDELRTTADRIFRPCVDFELPVQDVTFVRNEHLNTRYSLETLLNEASEIKLEDPSKKDHTACAAISGQSQLDGAELGLLVQIDSDDDITGIPNIGCKTQNLD